MFKHEKKNNISTICKVCFFNIETLTFNPHCLNVPTANFPAKIFEIK